MEIISISYEKDDTFHPSIAPYKGAGVLYLLASSRDAAYYDELAIQIGLDGSWPLEDDVTALPGYFDLLCSIFSDKSTILGFLLIRGGTILSKILPVLI